MIALPDAPGTYVLGLCMKTAAQIKVGALGTLNFAPGLYLYVGSAQGPGGLRARLGRHFRTQGKRLHWHIDYVRAHGEPVGAVWATGAARLECEWAAQIAALPDASTPAEGFGASDCGCTAHFFRLAGTWERVRSCLWELPGAEGETGKV